MAVVDFEVRSHVAIVTLNRPEARNAINSEVAVRLADAWEAIRSDDGIRVAVLTGTGKVFCSGADLGQLIPLFSGAKPAESEWDERILSDRSLATKGSLRDFDPEKPIIAAINGHAIAGGMELVQGTDIRISVPNANFGVQEVKWAIVPAGGSTVRLPAQLPYAKAMELLLTGDLMTAKDALDCGFLNHVVEDALEKALEVAAKISENGPLAVSAIRRSVRRGMGRPEKEALVIEAELAAAVLRSEDAREGPRAFMEKRKPQYSGR